VSGGSSIAVFAPSSPLAALPATAVRDPRALAGSADLDSAEGRRWIAASAEQDDSRGGGQHV
jgi:hypothetical protein